MKPAETYVDDGFSAKTGKLEKREGFQRQLRDMGAGALTWWWTRIA